MSAVVCHPLKLSCFSLCLCACLALGHQRTSNQSFFLPNGYWWCIAVMCSIFLAFFQRFHRIRRSCFGVLGSVGGFRASKCSCFKFKNLVQLIYFSRRLFCCLRSSKNVYLAVIAGVVFFVCATVVFGRGISLCTLPRCSLVRTDRKRRAQQRSLI